MSKTSEEQLVCDLANVLERMENANSFALREEIRKQIDQERNNFRQTAMYIWLATKDHLLHRANRESSSPMSEGEKEQETNADLLTDTENPVDLLKVSVVDFAEVAKRKQASRDEDERALASGEKSREDLRLENSIFAPLGKPKIISLIGKKPLR